MPLIKEKGGERSDQQAGGAAACFFVTQNRYENGRFTVERKPL